ELVVERRRARLRLLRAASGRRAGTVLLRAAAAGVLRAAAAGVLRAAAAGVLRAGLCRTRAGLGRAEASSAPPLESRRSRASLLRRPLTRSRHLARVGPRTRRRARAASRVVGPARG